MPTQVCITIDTEFSIAGAFDDAALHPVAGPMVSCEVDGVSQGLGFLLRTLSQFRIPATFFIEALHRHYFRKDPMRPFVRQIEDAGHELQLHVHPCWDVFQYEDWRRRVRDHPRQDDFAGRDENDSARLIQDGIDIFKDWSLPAPRVFRSGNSQYDAALYRAIARVGIPVSSNIGVGMFDSGDADYRLYAGRHVRHGVLECPILTFSDWQFGGRAHLKALTIAGTSFAETRTLLEAAERAGMPLVVILTHPFEYTQCRDPGRRPARRHAVNQRRLTQLCNYLDTHRDRFLPAGLAAASAAPANPHPDNRLLKGRLWQSARRMATQVSYDRYGNWALGRLERRSA